MEKRQNSILTGSLVYGRIYNMQWWKVSLCVAGGIIVGAVGLIAGYVCILTRAIKGK